MASNSSTAREAFDAAPDGAVYVLPRSSPSNNEQDDEKIVSAVHEIRWCSMACDLYELEEVSGQ